MEFLHFQFWGTDKVDSVMKAMMGQCPQNFLARTAPKKCPEDRQIYSYMTVRSTLNKCKHYKLSPFAVQTVTNYGIKLCILSAVNFSQFVVYVYYSRPSNLKKQRLNVQIKHFL